MADTLTGPQKSALLWLRNRGGDGVFDKTGVLIASGDRAGVMRGTWNALEAFGFAEFYLKRKRFKVTEAGMKVDLTKVRESDCKEREQYYG